MLQRQERIFQILADRIARDQCVQGVPHTIAQHALSLGGHHELAERLISRVSPCRRRRTEHRFELTLADAWNGLYRAALPQLPVTLLNAVISTAKLADDLYGPSDDLGRTPVPVGKISLSIGLMNAASAAFGRFFAAPDALAAT